MRSTSDLDSDPGCQDLFISLLFTIIFTNDYYFHASFNFLIENGAEKLNFAFDETCS